MDRRRRRPQGPRSAVATGRLNAPAKLADRRSCGADGAPRDDQLGERWVGWRAAPVRRERCTVSAMKRIADRALVWSFLAALPTGLVVLGVIGERPREIPRLLLGLATAFVLAFVVSRTFANESSPSARFLAALSGCSALPLLALVIPWE
jgi:hypothetical protein